MKNSRRRDWQTLVRLIMRSSILGLRPLSLKGVWQAAYVILLVTGALAHAQVIETVAGGASGSAQPSQNVCVPIRAAAAHGTDIYVVSCNRIYKVDVQSTWTLVAGNGVFAFSGDGGPATSASLGQPESIALDTVGNLYILDTLNRRVREVSAATGVIQTIAGTGVSGSIGDGGPAISSQIGGHGGLAVDAQGNVFLADQTNNRVREIVASNGVIQTIVSQVLFRRAFLWIVPEISSSLIPAIIASSNLSEELLEIFKPLPGMARADLEEMAGPQQARSFITPTAYSRIA
jgi:hypothetical protein